MSRRRGLIGGEKGPVFVDYIETHGQEYLQFPRLGNNKCPSTDFEIEAVFAKYFEFGLIPSWGAHRLALYMQNPEKVFLWAGGYLHVNFPTTETYRTAKVILKNGVATYKVDNKEIAHCSSYAQNDYWYDRAFLLGVKNEADKLVGCRPEKIKSYVIRDYAYNDEIILRPCFYNGEYGLWNTKDNTFLGNISGQGAITGGYDSI